MPLQEICDCLQELLAVFHEFFGWLESLPEDAWQPWEQTPRDELVSMTLCLPFAQANIRWPVSSRLTATDATLVMGGGAETRIPPRLAEQLYRFGAHKGQRVRLDDPPG